MSSFYDELFTRVPPSRDPYLSQLEPRQISYVEARLLLHKATVHHEVGNAGEARALMEKVARRFAR